MSMKEYKPAARGESLRGQSLVELTLMLPVLLIILSGVLEFGFLFSSYLAGNDATRNSTRFSSDSDFRATADTSKDCSGANATTHFYRQTACQVLSELVNQSPTISLCLPVVGVPGKHCPRDADKMDDIIISVFTVARDVLPGDETIERYPKNTGEMGWSYDVDLENGSQSAARTGVHASAKTTADVVAMLDVNSLNQGYIMVEVTYQYFQILSLPWFTQFVGDPIPFRFYSVWPLVSAKPTPTT